MRLITDVFAFCAKEVPRWNTISISGYHIREAGSTAAQEVGFTLADGIEYVRAAVAAGLDVDEFGGQLSFFFNAHNDLLEEVAKFRAARRLWARIMKERFNAKKEKSMMLRFHAQTAGSTLMAQQVDNNIVRVTVQTLAAVLGGAQSLQSNSRDEALALPTEESVRTRCAPSRLWPMRAVSRTRPIHFHGRFLAGKPVIIDCPKLDDAGAFLEKLTGIFREATPKSVTLVNIKVPCCGGLKKIVDEAIRRSGKSIPVSTTVVGIKGEILSSG